MFNQFILNVKRQETPFYAKLYKIVKRLRKTSIPTIYSIHRPLYTISRLLINLRWKLQESLWSVPVFRTRCEYVGKNLRLPNGMPWIEGNHLEIEIGNNVTLGKITVSAGHTYDSPFLKIGNNSRIGYDTLIGINKKVEIGNDVMIAFGCFITDSNGHPVDTTSRHGSISSDEVSSIKICDNVWIAAKATVLKGVTVGEGSVVAAGAVVTKNVPPYTIVAGNPAKVIRHLT